MPGSVPSALSSAALLSSLCCWSLAVQTSASIFSTVREHLEPASQLELGAASRIINGTEVQNAYSKFSFFAMPTNGPDSDEWLGCGASIISPKWGITAAHCFGGGNEPCSGPKEIGLWLGDIRLHPDFKITQHHSLLGKSQKVKAEVVCHENFDGKCSHGHDMVLLKLKSDLPSWVEPVKLHLDGSDADAVGKVTTNMGFGLRESKTNPEVISEVTPSKMREAKLTIYENDYPACKSVYDGGYGCSDKASEEPATNKDQQLCAGAIDFPQRDTCSGDSGSPMVVYNGETPIQIGIVSYGGGPGNKMSGDGRICADPKYMGVYTRVSAFKDFIEAHVKDLP